MARRDWIRVRSRWWEDPDLNELTGAERRWGPFLMYLADGDPGWRDAGIAWLLRATGGPLTCKDLATLGQEKGNRVAKLLGKLEAMGVLVRREDGAYGFRNYRKHQEDPSTSRQRRRRAKSDKGVTVTQVEAGMSREKQKQKQKQKQKIEAEFELTPPLAADTQSKSKPKTKKTHGCSDEDWSKVRDWLVEALHELDPKLRGPKDSRVNREHVRRPLSPCAASVDDWHQVIRDQLESVRSRPEAWRYLSLGCLGKPKNFATHLEGRNLAAKPTTHTNRMGGDIRTGSVGAGKRNFRDRVVKL